MTQAVSVRRDGDLFQARMFWLRAAMLLVPNSGVTKVGFETGPKAFDDIWVDYALDRGARSWDGSTIEREHIQCKWHTTPGTYGYAQLADPEFINAKSRSLLNRAHDAYTDYIDSSGGGNIRFKLLTNWQIQNEDPLRRAIAARSGSLRADRLSEGKTDRSAMGGLRRLWREHLGLTDEDLLLFAPHLAINSSGSLDELRDNLELRLMMAGLDAPQGSESALIYDELIFAWMAQGHREFEAANFREAVAKEGLLNDSPKNTFSLGVKSFEHALDPIEDRCAAVLDLTPQFDQRFLKDTRDWTEHLMPQIKAFLVDHAKGEHNLRIVLDAHLSLSFAAGAAIDLKSGRGVEIEQRTLGKAIWSANDQEPQTDWDMWKINGTTDSSEASENLVVAIGLTHNIADAVEQYAKTEIGSGIDFLGLKLVGGASAQSVQCGRHAFDLAASAVEAVRKANPSRRTVHLFLAAPNTFAFYLGQRHSLIEPIQLYEFDFEGKKTGSYQPSLRLPN